MMNSNDSSNFQEVVTPPWRLVSQNEPRSDSLLSREALLPDPTHVSPFLYPTSPPSRRRKPRHDSECTMEVRSSSAPARAIFGPLTMGWSFQMQLQDLDKQSDRDYHDPRSPSGKLGSKKPPARSARTSSARTLSRTLSHSPTYPSQIVRRSISCPQCQSDKRRQVDDTCMYTQPAALAHTTLVESQILNSSKSNGRSPQDFPSANRNRETPSRRTTSDSVTPSHLSSSSSSSSKLSIPNMLNPGSA
ncbi:uncharacterized protein C8R40DRAFT_43220 [Lentinula edodes]|uniref:uncharacterized protein n=1 Tax=Lentinula edodes TaxID=5353 RepID=UPI001E8E7FE4|nr:uncharacterized protein C8R40DRAFT_43220 [Lentinula edodes]KAH7881441.1 hypothetical protein C8R40DRAFT_43220 [Lentinula edodes]